MQLIRVRIKATGQVLEMVPYAAMPMILGGTAERLNERGEVETQMVKPSTETAVAPAQHSQPKRKRA